MEMQNTWRDRLALIFPQTAWLQFTDRHTGKARRWLNGMFVSGCEYAFSIEPFGKRDFIIQARYADNYPDLPDYDIDFRRYLIDLPRGKFDVQYCYTITDDFYDGDTHTRVSDLVEYAAAIQAHAWTGEVVSNQVTVDRDNQPLKSEAPSGAPEPGLRDFTNGHYFSGPMTGNVLRQEIPL